MSTKSRLVLEKHSGINWLRDIILGGQDGLVNVLGIVLGVTAATSDNRLIIIASLAAAFAEAVSMGAVAYTSTLADKNYYEKERQRESSEVDNVPDIEREEIRKIYQDKGFDGDLLDKVVAQLTKKKDVWVNTMMEEELGLKDVDTSAIIKSSLLVALTALMGAFIPILPYFFTQGYPAMVISLVISSLALFAIGAYQAKTYVGIWWKKGLQMVVIGMGAAIAGYFIGKLFGAN